MKDIRHSTTMKMIVLLAMGFASGLPFLLTGGTLKMWMAREQIDLSTIGYIGWVSMAYSLKFLWAPLLDRFTLLGSRRRGWILLMQALLAVGIVVMGTMDPRTELAGLAALAVIVAFLSATQDIVIDAYRREVLRDEELGFGMTMGNYGHRLAMWISGGVGVGMVGTAPLFLEWKDLYVLSAIGLSVGFVATLLAPEPPAPEGAPRTLKDAFLEPLKEFFSRKDALFMAFFVMMYKFGDAMSGAMLNPFYVQMGYSNADVGFIAKTMGIFTVLIGMFVGSAALLKLGIYRALWIFGILQALSTAGFALITYTGPQRWALAFAVLFEDFSAGLGNSAFIAFIASISDRRYSAAQFAALASLATVGRNFFSGFSGDMVNALGWAGFFYTCALIAIPGLVMLFLMRDRYSVARA